MPAGVYLLSAFLMAGPPSHDERVARVLTADRQHTFVAASDCKAGQGWMMKSEDGGKHMKQHSYWFMGQKTDAATLATILCYPFTHPREPLWKSQVKNSGTSPIRR
jgi:hypothetical protein